MMPFMGIAGTINAKITQQKLSGGSDKTQETNLLAGDAINNYRTVASFANEEAIVQKYEEMVREQYEESISKSHFAGLAFGFS